jgi:DNA polymerase III delta prime subunit
MKCILIVIIISVGLTSCQKKGDKKAETDKIEIQNLELNDIVHDSLTTEQLKDIKTIQKAFAEVNSSTLEETILNFKRDQHPDSEIVIWLAMAGAYEKFILSSGKPMDLSKKKEAYDLILLRSMMTEAEVVKQMKSTSLTEKEVKEIFSYYTASHEPLKVKME